MAERVDYINRHRGLSEINGPRGEGITIKRKSLKQAVSEAVLVVAAISFPGSNAANVISQDVFQATVANVQRLTDLKGRFAYRVQSVSTKEQRTAIEKFTDPNGLIETSKQKLRANAQIRNAPSGSAKSTILFEKPRGTVLDVVGCIPEADSCVVKFGEKGQVGFVDQDRFNKISTQ